MPVKKRRKTAYVVAVDMGYGHQRAVYPLRDIAEGDIILANRYAGIPPRDRRLWESGRMLYERVSRMKHVPVVGTILFDAMDYVQRIPPFYPRRDLSRPGFQTKEIYRMIRSGWGNDLIDMLNKKPCPLITSFFTVAFFAEEHGYHGEIYAICTDADVSRAWAPLHPAKTRITYLVPNRRVKERLELYGVPHSRMFITGFPLPKENIGKDLRILKENLGCRIGNLDPEQRFQKKYEHTLQYYLGERYCNLKSHHPLTITFVVGGAGAQRELGAAILNSLKKEIKNGQVRLNLAAGTRNDTYRFFRYAVRAAGLEKKRNGHVNILYAETKMEYFFRLSEMLRTTDILWTKPSELSFYAGLGLPIIMAPTIGSQEEFNKAWLRSIGAGVEQEDPRYTNEWLFDWLRSGWLAEAAMSGFMDAPRNGTYHIEDIVLRGKKSEIEDMHLL